MIGPRLTRPLLALGLAMSLGGCAALPRLSHWVSIRPVKADAARPVAREDGYYLSATAAISRRDYADALEQLQAARARKADDIRVLNAFGVVYDKLGRFDLSARYYEQARALDPTSTIVARNIGYSAELKGRASDPILMANAEPQALSSPIAIAEQAPSRPAVLKLGFAPAGPALAQGLTGSALQIADATGRAGGAEPVRQRLMRLGWSAPAVQVMAAAPRSVITYPADQIVVARGLARTLPLGVALVECAAPCHRIRLALGADSVRWAAAARGD